MDERVYECDARASLRHDPSLVCPLCIGRRPWKPERADGPRAKDVYVSAEDRIGDIEWLAALIPGANWEYVEAMDGGELVRAYCGYHEGRLLRIDPDTVKQRHAHPEEAARSILALCDDDG